MFGPAEQSQFARSCTDASFGYARSMLAMYAETSQTAFSLWSEMAKAATPFPDRAAKPVETWFQPERTPRTAYRPETGNTTQSQNPVAAWFAMFSPPSPATPAASANPIDMMMQPMMAMWNVMPMAANPAVWPMAYGMMSAGVPRSVAWPAAEANTAAMEAISTAANAMGAPYSSYHSVGGYASAQVWSPANMMRMAGALPFGAAALFPWLPTTAT